MKVLTSKIVNGKKMFLIEDNNPQGKVFAQGGNPIKKENISNYNPYYVDVKGLNASESTRTKLTPDVKFTSNELLQIINSQTSAKAIADKEAKDKATRLSKSESAYQKRIKTGIQSSQELADETGAIGDKISLKNLPIVGKHIPEILDVTGMFGNMASGLGRIPLNLEQRNYGQAALSVATPLTVGALAGIGTQNTSQFVNNLVNPLAGIKLKANLPEGTVQNGFSLSKLNERINLEPNELMGTNAYKIKLKDKWIGDFQLEKSLKDEGKIAIGNVYIKEPYRGKGFGKQVFTEGNKLLNDTEQGVLHSSGFFEGNDAKHVWNSLVKEGKAEQIGKDAWRFIEKSPSSKNFKSEIDWGKWNKEIPDNTQLMNEYNAIEQNLNSSISEFKNLENKFNIKQKELWQDYKSGKITGEDYSKQIKSEQPWDPFESPIFPLEKQLRELSVKKDILNAPQKNILKNEQQLGKNISDGGTNNKGVFELNDNYVARLSAHGYDDASRLLNYNTRIKSPRIMKTQQVKELNGKVFQVQDKAIGKPYTQLSETELKNLPKEHIDNFYKDIAELEKNGLSIDISGGKSNIFYDSKKGFQFIDLGIGKMPDIDDINKVVNFKNPVGNFKSKINWGQWNKEIPDNKALMQEYNAIEQTSKANGTWMKNPDGSAFQGTSEQFVQQNSQNFKKAFPKGYDKVYRGGNNETLENRPHPIVFTGDKATAQYYTGSSDFANTVATPTQESGRVLFDLYHPKSNNSIVINNQGKSWREIPRKYFGDNPPLRDLHNSKGDFTSTDDIAKWIIENDKNSVRLNNIFDSYDADFVNIINHKQGNYLKSAVGNNGMFDMTNPNIYKTFVGALATGTLGKQAMEKKEFGGKILNTKIENGKKYFLINE